MLYEFYDIICGCRHGTPWSSVRVPGILVLVVLLSNVVLALIYDSVPLPNYLVKKYVASKDGVGSPAYDEEYPDPCLCERADGALALLNGYSKLCPEARHIFPQVFWGDQTDPHRELLSALKVRDIWPCSAAIAHLLTYQALA